MNFNRPCLYMFDVIMFQFEKLFQPYIKYCMEEASCVKYLKQLKRDNETFQEFLAVCQIMYSVQMMIIRAWSPLLSTLAFHLSVNIQKIEIVLKSWVKET